MKIYFSKKMYDVEGVDSNPCIDDVHTVIIVGVYCEESDYVPPQNVNGAEGVAVDINSTIYGLVGIGSIGYDVVFCAH